MNASDYQDGRETIQGAGTLHATGIPSDCLTGQWASARYSGQRRSTLGSLLQELIQSSELRELFQRNAAHRNRVIFANRSITASAGRRWRGRLRVLRCGWLSDALVPTQSPDGGLFIYRNAVERLGTQKIAVPDVDISVHRKN